MKKILSYNQYYESRFWNKDEKSKDLIGKRIKFISSSDKFTKLKNGDMGSIYDVDEIGIIRVHWDNGLNIGLFPKTDKFEIL